MNGAERLPVLAIALGYLAAVVIIGLVSARRTRDARDFFIAGQRLGLVVTGLATMSAAFSGFVFLGGPGLTYRLGVASLWIVLPLGFTSALLCWSVGRKLRDLAGSDGVLTVPDAVQARFASRPVTALAAVAVLSGSVSYLGLQLQALAIVLQSVFGITSYPLALAMGLAVVATYSALGGMVAGVWTDTLQGSWMLFAAIAVFVTAVDAGGGFAAMAGDVAGDARFGAAFLEPFGNLPPSTAFGFFFVFGVGVLGQPQMLHKFYMLRDPARLRWLPVVLGGSQAICVLIWVGVGLAVPALVARGALEPLSRADDAAPLFLAAFASPAVAGIAYAGILAAIMSSADSFINLASAAVVRDLPRACGRPLENELIAGRLAVLGIGVAAAAVAWSYGDLIALLGTFAFGTFAASLAPALAVGLNWRGVTARAAGASIATGLVAANGLELLSRQAWFRELPRPPLAVGMLPSAAALALSFLVLLVVSLADRRGNPRLSARIEALIDG